MEINVYEFHLKDGESLEQWRRMNDSSDGAWPTLLRKGAGYLSSYFAVSPSDPLYCVIVDCWAQRGDNERFEAQHKDEYDRLTEESRRLFSRKEERIGSYELPDDKPIPADTY